jgi:hypothetical protein
MSSLKSRIRRIETGLDVSRLSREQIHLLDISKLTREQKEALDATHLTDKQIFSIGMENLTCAQLDALSDLCPSETAAHIETLNAEELNAVAEGRMCVWFPGYIQDSTK